MEQNAHHAGGRDGHSRDLSGANIGRYRIESLLGSGGMGEVYRAFDTTLKRRVAIKRMTATKRMDEASRRRFMREAQNASALNHPRIAAIHDVLEKDNEIFLVMEYVEGSTLRRRLGSPMSVEEFFRIAKECAEGVQAAHKKGIVHHDIKPENIMITPEEMVKILDFGVARRLPSNEADETTDAATEDQGTTSGGTLTYMAPEVLLGKKSDARADVFSMGLVFFEMLGGKHPYRGATVAATVDNILHGHPRELEALNPTVPPQIPGLIERMMARDPESRPQNAAEVAGSLRALQSGKEGGLNDRLLQFLSRRTRRMLALAAVALVLVLISPPAWRAFRGRAPSTVMPAEKILVVLPLTNLSMGGAGQDLCNGLAMVLPSSLRRMSPELRVIDGSEVNRRKIDSIDKAVREFRITLALTGNFLFAENRLQLDLNLVKAEDLTVLDSSREEMTLPNLVRLEKAILPDLARMLRLGRSSDLLAAQGTSTSRALELYLKGRGLLKDYDVPGNVDRAIEFFWQATREDGNYAEAFAALGEAYWGKYEWTRESQWVDRAKEFCDRARQLNNRLPAVYISLGRIRAGTGQIQEAIADFRRAMELDRNNPDAYLQLARTLEKIGQLEEAEKQYLEAIRILPGDWNGYNELASFYYFRGLHQDAERQWLRALDLKPDNVSVCSNLGGVYFAQERWDEARRMFKKCIEIRPDSIAYSNLGTLEFQLGRYSEAASLFEEAIKLDSKDYRLWGNMAGAQMRFPGGTQRARRSFEEAVRLVEEHLKLDPKDAAALATAADYCSMMGKRSRALDYLRQSLQLQPDNVEIMYAAAQIREQLGDRKEALGWIGKVLDKGYSRARIESSPALVELRKDPEYRQLASEKGRK